MVPGKIVAAAAAVFIMLILLTAGSGQNNSAGAVVRSIYVNHKGGSDFNSIQAAIDSIIPVDNGLWIRVHVAAGVYSEKVMINKSFVLLEGEGREQTWIEWADHNDGRSGTTANSPTFASYANDFMARDISFKNTYDGVTDTAPAVAAHVSGDRSSFYRCGFVGVQDTLSDLQGRHYYDKCYIEGAIDFIFGYGRSIFQGCELWTGKTPVGKSPGFVTAQGRDDEMDDGGFVFKGCTVGGVTPVYLGRAWRSHSRVIFYQTDMSGVVVSKGWDSWGYKGREGTLMMVESGCTGPGSNRTGRVPWSRELSAKDVARFIDLAYVSGDGWLAAQPR